jgi:DNA invertase Pin-like site-specific DNA recombinase
MGLEVSRLARSSLDWHHLLEMCAMTGTLILDEDGLYDPATFNDRLLLGLKGTMSEAELHVLRARLRGGILNKASRAALKLPLPMGLTYAEDETVILDPDAQIRASVGVLFATFKRTGSATATVKYFRTKGLLFPRRVRTGPHKGEVHWGPLLHSTTLKVLRNPRYAGAFCACRARARRNSLTVHTIRRLFHRSNGSFSCETLTLGISPGRSMKRICSSCSRIVPPTEKIAATVLPGKVPPCSRGWSSVGAVAIG